MAQKDVIKYFVECGLINVCDLDPTIKTDIRYATENNFTGDVLYNHNPGTFCVPELAHAIVKANKLLKHLCPSSTIIIFDAARPMSVQRKMYDLVKDTPSERYVANPYGAYSGGFHNYGMAVDLSICDNDGTLWDMGTDFDSFREIAHVGSERVLLDNNEISFEAYRNRMLLYYIMAQNGLLPYRYEWWHYQYHQREEDKSKFILLEI